MNENKKQVMYHKQAERDRFAEIPDMKKRIIETTMKQILESYNEFLGDLLTEQMEAY